MTDEKNIKHALDPTTLGLTKRLIGDYLTPYRRVLGIGLFFMVIGAACTAFMAKQMEPIIDDIFISRDPSMLMIVALEVFVLFLLKGISHFGQSVSMTYVGERIVTDMRLQLMKHVLKADLNFFHNTPSGELISRFTTDLNMLREVINKTITSLVKDGLTLIFLVLLMFYTDWKLATFAFIGFPLAFYPIIKIGKSLRKRSNTIQKDMAQFTISLSQIFQGARLIKSYNMEERELTTSRDLINDLFQKIMKAARAKSATHPIMEFMGGMAIVVVILYGGSQVIAGTQTSGAFFSFITALLLAYEPLKHIANLNSDLQEKLASAIRVFSILEVEPDIKDSQDAKPLVVEKGTIDLKDIHFGYAPNTKALKGVSLTIEAGKKTALVGASGSGKSTIVNLIPRFYDVDQGAIEVDGQDIRHITTHTLRDHVALVSQEIMLFDDTIGGNIAYGKPGASKDEIIQAAKSASAHDFINGLPNGYDTKVGELGVKLSGGQRQRIAIARAMLKNAPILLLDEATSALDNESEYQVQQALNSLMVGRTTLIVAHRLSTVIDADCIYVMSEGKVVGKGPHKELIKTCAAYALLYKGQDQEKALTA